MCNNNFISRIRVFTYAASMDSDQPIYYGCFLLQTDKLLMINNLLTKLYTNGSFHNKLEIAHCTNLVVFSYDFQKLVYFLSEDLFYLNKQCGP